MNVSTNVFGLVEASNWHENTIRINGDIAGGTLANKGAVYSAGSETTIIVGPAATLTGNIGIEADGEAAHVINRGKITSAASTLLSIGAGQKHTSFYNDGTIHSTAGDGIFAIVANRTTIVNDGTINAVHSIAVEADHVRITLGADSVIKASSSGIDKLNDPGQEASRTDPGSKLGLLQP